MTEKIPRRRKPGRPSSYPLLEENWDAAPTESRPPPIEDPNDLESRQDQVSDL